MRKVSRLWWGPSVSRSVQVCFVIGARYKCLRDIYRKFKEGYEAELERMKDSIKIIEEARNKHANERDELQIKVKQLREENKVLTEYSKFVTNVSIGTVVVMVC